MKMNKTKVLHFTHTDLDALGCATVVKEALSDHLTVYTFYCGNNKVDDLIQTVVGSIASDSCMIYNGETVDIKIDDIAYVIISDIGTSIDTTKLLEETFSHLLFNDHYEWEDKNVSGNPDGTINHLLMFDHHKTNTLIGLGRPYIDIRPVPIEIPAYNTWYTSDKDVPTFVSAAYLLMEYFAKYTKSVRLANKTLHEFITRVSLYDTWEWKKREDFMNDWNFITIANVISLVGCIKSEKYLDDISHMDKEAFINTFEPMKDVIDSIMERSVYHSVDNFRVYKLEDESMIGLYVVDSSVNISILAEKLYEKFPITDVIKYIVFLYPSTTNVSFRSRGENDVTIIAKRYGGGGHKNAAGATLSNEEFLKYYVMYMGAEKVTPII